MPRLAAGAHQLKAGIGDERHAGIADKSDAFARFQFLQNLRPRFFGIVIVIGEQRFPDAVMREQAPGHARILARHPVGRDQHIKRAQSNIAEIADWRCDNSNT